MSDLRHRQEIELQLAEPVVADFIHRLDAGEMDGQFNSELSKLSYPQLLMLLRTVAGYAAGKDDSITHRLTAREREVLTLIASGKSSRQIASALGIAFKTAVCHRSHIQTKLNLHNVADLTRAALRMGLIEL